MERKQFNQLFQDQPGGAIMPLVPVNINGVVIGPGVVINPGAFVGGVNLFQLRGRIIAVELQNGVYIIRGTYT